MGYPRIAIMAGVFLTWLLISGLTTGFSATLGGWIYNVSIAECHKKNVELLERSQQGPLRGC